MVLPNKILMELTGSKHMTSS
jgi:hypothetical protein